MSPRRRGAPAKSQGFTYLGVMFLVSVLVLTAAMAGTVWSTVQRRESERELVFAGRQFQAAIEQYRQRSREGDDRYPRSLEAMLRDARAPAMLRHLRQIYVDPMTGDRQWALIRLPDGGIVGVHSRSGRVPLQRGALGGALAFPNAKAYSDWRFVAPSATGLDAASR